MKKIIVEFDSTWVLEHKDDDRLPVNAFIEETQRRYKATLLSSTVTGCEIAVDETQEGLVQLTVCDILETLFDDEVDSSWVKFYVTDYQPPAEEVQPDEASSEKERRQERVDAVLQKIDALAGAEELKALARECAAMAPIVAAHNTYETFARQSYLFSINDGDGLTTRFHLFVELLGALGLLGTADKPKVLTERLSQPTARESEDAPFEQVLHYLRQHKSREQVLFLDICEWMTRTEEKPFRRFLSELEGFVGKTIVVFRVPFVEKEILTGLCRSLGDVLFVREVSFVPLDTEQLTLCADDALQGWGFTMQEDARELFCARLAEEKKDGRFYGLKTVRKIVHEMIYLKQKSAACSGIDDTLIRREDILALTTAQNEEKSGMAMLEELVGMEPMCRRVEEIVAQIEMSLKNKALGSPCIHMRFVGNPGTGKTTVARVIGRILKERGILRNGNFFERTGRDLCGRYVGETAPKTAAICRDAYGSVLFIDEAYSLYRGERHGDADFGREAIDTLIAEMENHRSDLVVIMAGYTDEMETLLQANPGLASRMPYVIEFPNYTREQLYDIFMRMVKRSFPFREGFAEAAQAYFTTLPDEVIEAKEFSNARFVRNLFERTWGKAVLRTQLHKEEETVLTKEDFLAASAEKEFRKMMQKPGRPLGFV